MQNLENCPCGRDLNYDSCCGKIHSGKTPAKTAEDLMRSRYTAFTLADGEYLMKSHLKQLRPNKQKKSIVKWAKSVDWLKLEILKTEKGQEEDDFGIVEFNAFFMEGSEIQCLHEESTFVKENAIWFYEKAL